MIPVSLYGVDVNRCESFYDKLPGLVADSIDDEEYSDAPVSYTHLTLPTIYSV